MADRKPTLHVIAGPNGAGKTSFYEDFLRGLHPAVAFVNADQLAHDAFGHPAVTLEESEHGQRLAEVRRNQLMAEGKSLIVESTFSHPSKVDLVRTAIANGYAVRLYHLHLANPELSVLRVKHRVDHGGHPVPEEKIRGRFERNKPIIREAALLADYAYVFDNSAIAGRKLALAFTRSTTLHVANPMPTWTGQLYGPEIQRHVGIAQRWLDSHNDAQQLVRNVLGADATVRIPAAQTGLCRGKILGRTALHLVQEIGPKTAMLHVADLIDGDLSIGEPATILYVDGLPRALHFNVGNDNKPT